MPIRKPPSEEEANLVQRAREVLPGGTLGNLSLPSDQAVLICRGKGSHIQDMSGNDYIDYLLGSGPMVLGHAHPSVIKAVQEAVANGTTFFATNSACVHLAEELVRAIPCADQVRFVSTGTEATMYAMRLARAHRRRDIILKFEGGFHGMNDYALMSVTPKTPPPFPQAQPNSAGIPRAVQDSMLVAPFNDIEATETIIKRHHDELAGVIIEPFQRVIPPVPGFLEGLREITKRFSLPLIFDEIVTGFRFAYGGAQEYYGVIPDMATYGKIIAGGFPLAAVAGSAELMRYFDPQLEGTDDFLPQIGTLSGNPIAAAAGLATLRELKKPGSYARLFDAGRRVRLGLEMALQAAELPAQVVGIDPLFDVLFTEEPLLNYRAILTADPSRLRQFTNLLIDNGVFKGSTKFYVSLAHTDEDIQKTLEVFHEAAQTMAHQN